MFLRFSQNCELSERVQTQYKPLTLSFIQLKSWFTAQNQNHIWKRIHNTAYTYMHLAVVEEIKMTKLFLSKERRAIIKCMTSVAIYTHLILTIWPNLRNFQNLEFFLHIFNRGIEFNVQLSIVFYLFIIIFTYFYITLKGCWM